MTDTEEVSAFFAPDAMGYSPDPTTGADVFYLFNGYTVELHA